MRKKITVFNKQFLQSLIAIFQYFFKVAVGKRVRGTDFFSERKYQELKKRIENLSDREPPKWGIMRVDQMLHHLNLSIGSGLGLYQLPDESNLLSRTVIRWLIIDLFSGQPKGLQLPLCLAIPLDERFDFEIEKIKLLAMLDVATTAESPEQWHPHCYFGKLSVIQWGKLCSIHLDHHLRQFSV